MIEAAATRARLRSRVAADAGRGGAGQFGRAIAVYQGGVRGARQAGEGDLHGAQGGVEDVQPVDGGDIHDADADIGRSRDLLEQRLSGIGGDELGVIEAGKNAAFIEDDRGRNHGASPRPAPSLVNAGNKAAMRTARLVLQLEVRHFPPAFWTRN